MKSLKNVMSLGIYTILVQIKQCNQLMCNMFIVKQQMSYNLQKAYT